MNISIDLITGIALGIEYISECEEHGNVVIVDILIFRLLFEW